MPSVFPPVDIEGRRYIDGGVADNVPIKPALDMGAETLYVMNSTSHTNQRRPLVRPMDYLLHAFTLARSQRFVSDVDRYSQRAQLIILPASTLDFFVPFASMEFTGQLIERSYEDTSRYLDARTKPGSQLQAE
jgi:NTE family protein